MSVDDKPEQQNPQQQSSLNAPPSEENELLTVRRRTALLPQMSYDRNSSCDSFGGSSRAASCNIVAFQTICREIIPVRRK